MRADRFRRDYRRFDRGDDRRRDRGADAVIVEIVTSRWHGTVWDGADTLFDFNWQAFGIPADRCFRCAHDEVLWFGQRIETQLAEDFSTDVNADH
jgi:hypothetical protein